MASVARRWDGDERGRGIAADGGAFADDLRRLLTAVEAPDWVAEEPDLHLLPHLRRVCDDPNTPWALRSTDWAGGVFSVAVEWTRDTPRLGLLRADVFALLGAIAESVTAIHQHVAADGIHYDVVTGMLDGDTPFRPHGHLLRLVVSGATVPAISAGTRCASPDAP